MAVLRRFDNMFENAHQASLNKEEARIKAKREANERRCDRFLNARVRTLGVDVAGLNAQVAEKQANAQNGKDNDKLERKILYLLLF